MQAKIHLSNGTHVLVDDLVDEPSELLAEVTAHPFLILKLEGGTTVVNRDHIVRVDFDG